MATVPVIRFSQFDITKTSPAGFRHLKTHAAYVKELNTNPSGYLDFGSMNISNGKRSSPTKAVVAMVDHMNGATTAVYNLRFWMASQSDWKSGTYYFNGRPSGSWKNLTLTDASGVYVPAILPSGQNWWRQDGGLEITASGADAQCTQYMYLSVTLDDDVPVGVYGGDGGGWAYRLTYDYR